MSTLLLVCSLAPALESHYCCGARRSGGIPDCSYHIDLLCSSGYRIIREVKGGWSVIKWAIFRGGC